MNDYIPQPTLSKNEILTQIYCSAEITEVLNKIQPDYERDDLKNHVFLLLLEKPDDFILDLHKIDKLKNYIVKTLFQLTKFKEDAFHRVRRRSTEILVDEFPTLIEESKEEDVYSYCDAELGKIYWYHAKLLELYAELGSFKAVSILTKIPAKSVHNAVVKARNQIKAAVQCQL